MEDNAETMTGIAGTAIGVLQTPGKIGGDVTAFRQKYFRKEDSTITVRKPCRAGILRVEIRESFEETREGFAETKVDVAETRVGVAETRVGVAETRVSVAETGESLKIKRNTYS